MNIEIADRLLNYRKSHGFSQEELAEKIGVSRQAVSKWERAEASPDTDNLINLAKIYGVTLDELLKGKTEDDKAEPDKETAYVKGDFQDDESENITEDEKITGKKIVHIFLIGILALMGTLFWGFSGQFCGFALSWICLLAIPVYYSFVEAVQKHNADCFAYPVICVVFQMITGFLFDGWSWGWTAYLTIPVYYGIVEMINKSNEN